MERVEAIERKLELMKKNTKLIRKYSFYWSEPDSLIHPRGAWIILNEHGRVCDSIAFKSKKQKAIDYINELNSCLYNGFYSNYTIVDYDDGEYAYSSNWENSYWESVKKEMYAKLKNEVMA